MIEATLQTYFDELVDMLSVPERNCSCHISPPCADCVDNDGLRQAIVDVRFNLQREMADAIRYRALRNATDAEGYWIAHGTFYGGISRCSGETADNVIDSVLAKADGL